MKGGTALYKEQITAEIFKGFVDKLKTLTPENILSPSITTAIHGIYLLAKQRQAHQPARAYISHIIWSTDKNILHAYIAMLRKGLTDADYRKDMSHLYLSQRATYFNALTVIIQAKMKEKCPDIYKGNPGLSLKIIKQDLTRLAPAHSSVPYLSNKMFFNSDQLDDQLVNDLMTLHGLPIIPKNIAADHVNIPHNAEIKAMTEKLSQTIEIDDKNCLDTSKTDHIKIDLDTDHFSSLPPSPNSIHYYFSHTPATKQAMLARYHPNIDANEHRR